MKGFVKRKWLKVNRARCDKYGICENAADYASTTPSRWELLCEECVEDRATFDRL